MNNKKEILDKHVSMLREHFDVVEIFASSVRSDGSTISVNRGAGNWFARYGQVRLFIEGIEEYERICARKLHSEE